MISLHLLGPSYRELQDLMRVQILAIIHKVHTSYCQEFGCDLCLSWVTTELAIDFLFWTVPSQTRWKRCTWYQRVKLLGSLSFLALWPGLTCFPSLDSINLWPAKTIDKTFRIWTKLVKNAKRHSMEMEKGKGCLGKWWPNQSGKLFYVYNSWALSKVRLIYVMYIPHP